MPFKPTVSLTFDDGLPCQVEYALPALDRAGMLGTFFLIQNSPYSGFDGEAWKRAVSVGHEIGSHSVNHLKAASLSTQQAEIEAQQSRRFLENELGIQVSSFAYPFTDAFGPIREAVPKYYRQARGGRVARENKFITPNDGVDWMNVPCFHVGRNSLCEIPGWIAEATKRNAWLVLMFHGIGPDESQWDNISVEEFEGVLAQLNGIRVLPFGQAAEEVRNGR